MRHLGSLILGRPFDIGEWHVALSYSRPPISVLTGGQQHTIFNPRPFRRIESKRDDEGEDNKLY